MDRDELTVTSIAKYVGISNVVVIHYLRKYIAFLNTLQPCVEGSRVA